jgi:hypothetical protein
MSARDKIMKIIIISILASLCSSLFAETTPLELEERYLEKRAVLLTEKRDALLAIRAEGEQKGVEKEFDKKLQQMKRELLKKAGDHIEFANVLKWITDGNLKEEMPFDIIEYLENPDRVFETYNTFSVPVEKRSLVQISFKEGRQYRDGRPGPYRLKKEGEFGVRRSRPLKNGGTGTDVIQYDIYTHKFIKPGVSTNFMWLKKRLN